MQEFVNYCVLQEFVQQGAVCGEDGGFLNPGFQVNQSLGLSHGLLTFKSPLPHTGTAWIKATN